MKFEFNKLFRFGLFAAAGSLIATFVLGFLKLVPTSLFATIPLANPITATPASRFFDILKGTFHFDGTGFLTLVISAFILAFLGTLLYGILEVKAKEGFQKTFATLMLGTVAAYVLIVGLVMAAWTTILGVLIYGAIVSFIAAWLDGIVPNF